MNSWKSSKPRYGRGANLITSQIPVDKWHNVIGDPTYVDGLAITRLRIFNFPPPAGHDPSDPPGFRLGNEYGQIDSIQYRGLSI
jgi:hypothetical protein